MCMHVQTCAVSAAEAAAHASRQALVASFQQQAEALQEAVAGLSAHIDDSHATVCAAFGGGWEGAAWCEFTRLLLVIPHSIYHTP